MKAQCEAKARGRGIEGVAGCNGLGGLDLELRPLAPGLQIASSLPADTPAQVFMI